MDRHEHYEWLKTVPGYPEEFAEAQITAATVLEDEAVRRATEGVKRPIFQGGECVGHELVYSDTLMQLLMKGHLPTRYRERIDQTVSITGDVLAVLISGRERIKDLE